MSKLFIIFVLVGICWFAIGPIMLLHIFAAIFIFIMLPIILFEIGILGILGMLVIVGIIIGIFIIPIDC